VNLWQSLNFKVLFHGTDLEGETAKWESVVGYWLEINDFLNCLHIDCDCKLDAYTFSEYVKKICKKLQTIGVVKVTPYFHALIFHVPNMLVRCHSLKKYSTSAQELKNSLQTIAQFRQSNQHNIPYDLQVNQLMFLWFHCKLERGTTIELKRCTRFDLDEIELD